jgi:hypothetical protein
MLGMGYTHAVLSALTDLFFLFLIYPVVSRTNLTPPEKRNVALLLALSTLGFVASVVRIKWISILVTHSLDFFYKAQWLAIWSAIEPGLGIIASSLATLRPFFREIESSSGSAGRWTWSRSKSTKLSDGTKVPTADTKEPITWDKDIEKQEFSYTHQVPQRTRAFLRPKTHGNDMTFLKSGTGNLSPMISKAVSEPSDHSSEDGGNDWFPIAPRDTITSPHVPIQPLTVSSLSSTTSPSPWASFAVIRPDTTTNGPSAPEPAALRPSTSRPRTSPFRMPSSRATTSRSRRHPRPFEWAGTADGLIPIGQQIHLIEAGTEQVPSRRGIGTRMRERGQREGLSLGIFGDDKEGHTQRKRLSGSSIASSIAQRLRNLRRG